MDNKQDSGAQLIALARKHKVALGIGAGVLLLLAMADGSNPNTPSDGPLVDSSSSSSSSSTGGFDKEKWDRDQRRDDIEQRDKIDTIREVERCVTEDGRVVEMPAGSCPT